MWTTRFVTQPLSNSQGRATFISTETLTLGQQESINTILAIVQAEKEGQIESKMMKARQMEEIREARRVEAEKKEAERKAKFDETKDSLRKKRKRPRQEESDGVDSVKHLTSAGSKATKSKKKRVSFAPS